MNRDLGEVRFPCIQNRAPVAFHSVNGPGKSRKRFQCDVLSIQSHGLLMGQVGRASVGYPFAAARLQGPCQHMKDSNRGNHKRFNLLNRLSFVS